MKLFSATALLVLLLLPSLALADGDLDAIESEDMTCAGDHSDCPPGYECVENVCTELSPGQCRRDVDCADVNQYCDEEVGLCEYYCYMDLDCEDGEYCDYGASSECLPIQVDGDNEDFCSDDSDCDEATEYCETYTHTCRPVCTDDEDCPENWVCRDFKCSPENPGDLDIDAPWLDYEEYAEESPEIPDWEMPEVAIETDKEAGYENEWAETGGLGESSLNGDKDKTAATEDEDSGSCQSTTGAPWFLALLLLAVPLRRRAKL